MAIRRGTRRSTTTSTRKWVWARATYRFQLGPNAITQANLLSDFEVAYGAQLIGSTVMRIRGVLSCYSVSATVYNTSRVGVIVERQPVVLAGPYTQPHADWMLYEPLVSGPQNAFGPASRVIDVKSSRKIEEISDQLTMVVQADPLNVQTLIHYVDLSIGVKLP